MIYDAAVYKCEGLDNASSLMNNDGKCIKGTVLVMSVFTINVVSEGFSGVDASPPATEAEGAAGVVVSAAVVLEVKFIKFINVTRWLKVTMDCPSSLLLRSLRSLPSLGRI